jgi:4-amino-4-deoxy-L-arabinose transferase-like glycosyltransferase
MSATSTSFTSSAVIPDGGRWIGPCLGIVVAVTAARIVLLALDQKQLFVDEAQYWFWGQDLAWGYFSKPPAIAWLIRAVTDLAGSDAPFWVRLPAPFLHGLTAMLLAALAARMAGGMAAIATVAVYLSLPLIAGGSLLMTTDTLMFPFLVSAYLAWTRSVADGSRRWAAAAGAALGLAFLSKYAAIYFLGAAALAALLVPAARPARGAAIAGLAAFVLTISPNLLWNLSNGLITLQHTVDNIEWARAPGARLGLEPHKLAEFAAAQILVFGPVFLATLLVAAARWRRLSPEMRALVLFSVPIILLVCLQAVLSRAYANWAAAAYLTGTVAVVVWLLPRSRAWLVAGIAVNAALCVAISVIATLPDWLPAPVRETMMQRYLGRTEMTGAIISLAEAEAVDTVVSGNRDILADLFYTGRTSDLTFRAAPSAGRPPHHYAMSWAFEGGADDALYVGDEAPACVEGSAPLRDLRPQTGYWSERDMAAWRVPGTCWAD